MTFSAIFLLQTVFSPNIIPTKHADPSQTNKKWPEKKLSFSP